jgi:ABC-2 type transport system ATP-binding protein
MTNPDRPAIETDGLRKTYGKTVALDDLDLRIERGEVFGLLGPNGAGKTTIIKLLLGLARPTAGGGKVLGRPLGDRKARRGIGYLPELFRYPAWLTGREVVRVHTALAALPSDGREREIDRVLDIAGILGRADDRVGGYSKGMTQRLGIAVALLGDPALALLDEPTSALDPVGRDEVRSIVRQARERGSTVVLNSHLLGEVERLCDRVAIVDRGHVIAAGPLDQLLGETAVRIRVTGLDGEAGVGRILAPFGHPQFDEGWWVIRPIDPERVPDAVDALVRAGGRVHAVDPARSTLEERFLELVGRSGEAGADAVPSGDTTIGDR